MSDTNKKNIFLRSSFKRTTDKPLEADTIFTSLPAAEEWVTSGTNAYVSQIIAVVVDGKSTHYKVEEVNGIKKLSELTPEIVAEDVDLSNYYTKEETDGLIASAGKVKDVKVNGETVLSGGTAEVKVTAKTSKIDNPIIVDGGPFAETLKSAGITGITEDMSVYDIFEKMFSKEIFPSITYDDASVISKINAPTISANYSNNTTVEVGTNVSLSEITCTESYVSSSKHNKVSGLVHGYSTELNGDVVKLSNGIIQKDVSYSIKDDDIYKMQLKIDSGFTNNETVTVSGSTVPTIESKNLGATKEGTNKITLTVTGKSYNYSAEQINSVYVVSNFGNTDENTKTNVVSSVNTNSNIPTASTTFTIYGKYKYFIGCYADKTFAEKKYSTESIRETDKKEEGFMSGTTINREITVPAGTKGMYIAIPEGIDDNGSTLKVKQVNTNAYVDDEMFDNRRTIELECGGNHTKKYIIFSWSFPGGTSGQEPFEITSF